MPPVRVQPVMKARTMELSALGIGVVKLTMTGAELALNDKAE